MNIDGRIVLITGGGGVIGAALGEELLRRGCRVILCDVAPAALEKARQRMPGARVVACDITREADVERLAAEVEREFGGLDVLVNNAVVNRAYSFVRDANALENMDLEIATNFAAPLRLTRRFYPMIEKSAEPAIVNVTSDLAHIPVFHKPLYTSLKAALHAFTVALRDDLADTKVRVFEVQPPPVGPEKKGLYFGLTPRMPADEFARAAIREIERDTWEIRIGASTYTYYMSRFFPDYIRKKMSVKKYTA